MALMFEPDRVVYDPEERLLRLFATDGLMLVRCAISKAALAALEDDALGSQDAMISTYRRNREYIQAIAEHKYRRRWFEPGGDVVVRLEDLILLKQPVLVAEREGARDQIEPAR